MIILLKSSETERQSSKDGLSWFISFKLLNTCSLEGDIPFPFLRNQRCHTGGRKMSFKGAEGLEDSNSSVLHGWRGMVCADALGAFYGDTPILVNMIFIYLRQLEFLHIGTGK